MIKSHPTTKLLPLMSQRTVGSL